MARADGIELPGDLYYDRRDHFWACLEGGRVRVGLEGGRVRVGLDMLGQRSAGPVKHIQLKPVGTAVAKKRMFGTIEAGKYVGALRAPVAGALVEVNEKVVQTPRLVNEDPYGQGWFVVIDPSNLEEDLKDLVHGEEAVQAWLEQEIKDYRQKGLLRD